MSLRLVLLFLFLPISLHAGFERSFRPASAFSMGTSGAASYGFGRWLVNPASLAKTEYIYLLGSFNPAPFGITELKETGAGGAFDTKAGGFGASASAFGYELYQEFTGRISWGRSIGSIFDIGLSLSYYHLSIQNYGSGGTTGLDAGVITHFGSSIRAGFVVTNINNPRIGSSREPLPQTITIGTAIDLLPHVSISAELFKDFQFPVSMKYGLEYMPLNALSFSVGTSSEPSIIAGGFGFSFSYFHIEYAIQYHQPLGISHYVTLAIAFSPIPPNPPSVGLLKGN
ncbi:MAG: hypothetical protein ABSB78_06070 [Bacteroidota bacterium]